MGPGLANPDPFKHPHPKHVQKIISNSNKSSRGAVGGYQMAGGNFENTPPQWGSEMDMLYGTGGSGANGQQ